MKNAINYYYKLFPKNIHQTKDKYSFKHNNDLYIIEKYQENPEKLKALYEFHTFILNNMFPIHQIIPNQTGQIITIINKEPYILMKINIKKENKNITQKDIIEFSKLYIPINKSLEKINHTNLFALWSSKSDHIENQIINIEKKYPLIKESFNYYIGLGETAIQLINKIKNKINVISHKRTNIKSTLYDLYNPLNLIIDSRPRDISEYFKSAFFNNIDINKNIFQFLATSSYTKEEHIIFLARMLYPTYYFDMYENIVLGNLKEKNIQKITSKADDYEKLIRNIYKYYKTFIPIETIEWLE